MNEDHFTRQQDVLDVSKLSRLDITLIGLGSMAA